MINPKTLVEIVVKRAEINIEGDNFLESILCEAKEFTEEAFKDFLNQYAAYAKLTGMVELVNEVCPEDSSWDETHLQGLYEALKEYQEKIKNMYFGALRGYENLYYNLGKIIRIGYDDGIERVAQRGNARMKKYKDFLKAKIQEESKGIKRLTAKKSRKGYQDAYDEFCEIFGESLNEYRYPFPENFEVRIGKPSGQFAHENSPVMRYAIDFLLEPNTPVLAARDGKVCMVKLDSDSYVNAHDITHLPLSKIEKLAEDTTNLICIDHSDGTYTEYLHLRKDEVAVQEGQEVKAGQLIGHTGLSGIMTQPHLHFNVFKIEKGYAISVPVDFEERDE